MQTQVDVSSAHASVSVQYGYITQGQLSGAIPDWEIVNNEVLIR